MFIKDLNFIITHGKPHKPAHKDTIARWIKELMKLAGIDTDTFKPHSCRSASASAAKRSGIPIDQILQREIGLMLRHFTSFIPENYQDCIKNDRDAGTSLLSQAADSH